MNKYIKKIFNLIGNIPKKIFFKIKKIAWGKFSAELRGSIEPSESDLEVVAESLLLKNNIDNSEHNKKLIQAFLKISLSQDLVIFDACSKIEEHTIEGIRRQQSMNIKNVVIQAVKQIEEDCDIPNFGSTKFLTIFDKIKNISDEDVHDLWSKLMAGEIVNKGSFSLVTIDALSKISSKDLKFVEEIASYVSNVGLLTDDYNYYKSSSKNSDDFSDIEIIFNVSVFLTTNYKSIDEFKNSRIFRDSYANGCIGLKFYHGVLEIEVGEDIEKINKVSAKISGVSWVKFAEIIPLLKPKKVNIDEKFFDFLDHLKKNGCQYNYKPYPSVIDGI